MTITIELDLVPFVTGSVETLLEVVSVDERHDLREDAFTLVRKLLTAA